MPREADLPDRKPAVDLPDRKAEADLPERQASRFSRSR
jgi:hypothetical protein